MIRLEFKPRDLWIGVYWSRSWSGLFRQRFINVWICLLPTLPIHIRHAKRLSEDESKAALAKCSAPPPTPAGKPLEE